MLRSTNITKLVAAGLVAGALVGPATAAAVPAVDSDAHSSGQPVTGQAVAAGGGPGVSAQDFAQSTPPGSDGQNLTAPDQVDRVAQSTPPGSDGQNLTAPDNIDRVAQTPAPQDLTAPDNIDRTNPDSATAPTWPTHAQPLVRPDQPAAAPSSSDDGVDTGVWIAAAGGVALIALGAGLAFRLRPRARQRSMA